jgi:hypothetical protein
MVVIPTPKAGVKPRIPNMTRIKPPARGVNQYDI